MYTYVTYEYICIHMYNVYYTYRTHIMPYTPNLPTNIVDFRGSDTNIISISRGGIPRPIGDFPESLSHAMLVGVMLVGRLGVSHRPKPPEQG